MTEDIFSVPVQSNWTRVVCIIPAEAFQVFDAARTKLEREGVVHPVEQVQNGMVLEILAAEYLSS